MLLQMTAQKGGRMSERAILKTLMVYLLIGCFLVSNVPCTYASSEHFNKFFLREQNRIFRVLQRKPKEYRDLPEYTQTESSENTSTEPSNYTEAESSENTQIKSSQNTKTESSEYQIKRSEIRSGRKFKKHTKRDFRKQRIT